MDPTADFEVDARSGVHETTEETDTVVFVGPGQELSFTRVIGTEFPVIIGYNEAQAVGGVESMVLLEDDSVLLQLSRKQCRLCGKPLAVYFREEPERETAERVHFCSHCRIRVP